MRRFLPALVAQLVVVTALGALWHVGPGAAGAQEPTPTGTPGTTPCVAVVDKWADPKVLLLGETTRITLTVSAVCAEERFPIRVILVLDASGSMAGDPNAKLREASKAMIDRLQVGDDLNSRMGIVKFNTVARRLCALTQNKVLLYRCVDSVDAEGGTAIDRGIEEGLMVLLQGRVGQKERVPEVMVVVSDGANNRGCRPVITAAGRAKARGVLMTTVCVGKGCDQTCMIQAATTPRYFFQAEQAGDVGNVFRRISEDVLGITLKRLTVVDELPANMRYVPGSAGPEPQLIDPQARQLAWESNYIPREGITLSFEVQPLEPGLHRTNIQATGAYTDNRERIGGALFPVPEVLVLQPFPLATPAGPPPTPTIPPPPPPSATPPPTPTPRPRPIYLPIALSEACETNTVRADVALVLDMSTSMLQLTRNNRPKVEAAQDAARHFLALMHFTPDAHGRFDQVAVVGFNRRAWIAAPLGNDPAVLGAAIDGLSQSIEEFTRLDLAMDRGAEALRDARRRPENTAVLVLLTDGLPNQVPAAEDGSMATTVLRASQAAKAEGIRVYTIGAGLPGEVDLDLLSAMASDRSMAYATTDLEQLNGIYSEISYTFGCPGGRHDWSRPWP